MDVDVDGEVFVIERESAIQDDFFEWDVCRYDDEVRFIKGEIIVIQKDECKSQDDVGVEKKVDGEDVTAVKTNPVQDDANSHQINNTRCDVKPLVGDSERANFDKNELSNGTSSRSEEYPLLKTLINTKPEPVSTIVRDKPFGCQVCDFRAAHRSELTRHSKIHSGKKDFRCELCNFATVHKSSYSNHLKTHSDTKDYRCDVCGFATKRKDKLSGHMRLHTGEKKHKCDICDFRTAHRSSLMKHVRQHSGEKNYFCHECGYRTSQKYYLTKHKRRHGDFACEVCGYSTRYKKNLNRHRQRIHPVKE